MKQPRDPPPPNTAVRWSPRRKLDVVMAIKDGRLTRGVALKAYDLSEEELVSWERLAELGPDEQALRTTRLQKYRFLLALALIAAPASSAPLSPIKCGHGHFPPCPPPPPPLPPVPVAINFAPAAPSLPDDTAPGTPIAAISVRMSDGSQFSGMLGFAAPNGNGGGVCAIAGSQVVLATVLPMGPTTVDCTITATQ